MAGSAATLGFVETGLRGSDHGIIFGIAGDTDPAQRLSGGEGGTLRSRSSAAGAGFVRFIGNAAVGRDGWPSHPGAAGRDV